MRFETLSVFPEVFAPYLDASIMGRAQRAGILDFAAHDLRDWTHDATARSTTRPSAAVRACS